MASPTSPLTRGSDRYDVLLGIVLLILLAAPFEGTAVRPFIVALLGFALLFAMWTSKSPTGFLIAGICVAVAGFAVSTAAQAASGKTPQAVFACVALVLCLSTISTIVRGLTHRLRVNTRTLAGSLSIYLLLGLFFTYLFALIGATRTGGFFAQPGPHNPTSYIYFSFITITTVGYGDLTAATDAGRMLAVLEALLGQVYLVTVVSVVVGNRARGTSAPLP